MPRVSVIVPVKNRRPLLAALLDALDAQTYRYFEVVVIDDGSTDGSGDEARGRAIAGRPIRLLEGAGNGAVAARKKGVAQACGEILAFTDSDCVPHPDWLRIGVETIDEGADIVNGLTRPARPMMPLERSMGSSHEGLFPTCNVFYRRAAYDAAGGFDHGIAQRWGFRPDARSRGDGFGEDTVLGWRIARAGTHRYAPLAIVDHHVFAHDYVETLSRSVRVAAFPAMIRDVPELRRTLCRHWFQLGERSRLGAYLTFVALAARRPRLALAMTLLWAALRWNGLRRYPIGVAEQAKLLPIEMAHDALMSAALIVGSVRARTLVL